MIRLFCNVHKMFHANNVSRETFLFTNIVVCVMIEKRR
nr:MAG TPA: hypothetical protein [Caudoviricetes sp.]